MFFSCHVRVSEWIQHSIVAWMSRNFLLETGAKSEVSVTATGLEPRTTFFVNEHSAIWPNGWVFVYELSGSGFESSCSHSSITSNSIKVTHVFYDKNQGVSTKTCSWKNLRLSWRFKYLFWKKNRTASIQGCLYIIRSNKCDVFRDLVTFVQF